MKSPIDRLNQREAPVASTSYQLRYLSTFLTLMHPFIYLDGKLSPNSFGPKIIRIPVHFVRSKQVDRTGAAMRIQKVFRGFSVRKCLKKVKDIRVQVDEIESKFSDKEIVELLRSDSKERLRMNETLMSLLLKLDSICGVDFGVSGFRKAVIRKVIALQERIDAIVAADLTRNGNGDGVTEIRASVEIEKSKEFDQPTVGI